MHVIFPTELTCDGKPFYTHRRQNSCAVDVRMNNRKKKVCSCTLARERQRCVYGYAKWEYTCEWNQHQTPAKRQMEYISAVHIEICFFFSVRCFFFFFVWTVMELTTVGTTNEIALTGNAHTIPFISFFLSFIILFIPYSAINSMTACWHGGCRI